MRRNRPKMKIGHFIVIQTVILVILFSLSVVVLKEKKINDEKTRAASINEIKVDITMEEPAKADTKEMTDDSEIDKTADSSKEKQTLENSEIEQAAEAEIKEIEHTEIEDTDHTDIDNNSEVGEVLNDNETKDNDTRYEQVDARVKEIMDTMTIYEKVCQLFFVYPEAITDVSPTTTAGKTTKTAIAEYPVGGILYESMNLITGEQTTEMISNIQSFSKIPLFIASDEEGGIVARVMKSLGTTHIDSMYYYKDDGNETAYKNANQMATDIASFGFNLDFAPVCDVWSNPDNTVIGKRAYSDDFKQAAELITYAIEGFHDGGVLCTLKHFPGHGDTAEDSHYGSAYVSKSLDELRQEEFLPFEVGIASGADMVMMGHLIVTDVDDLPATLSYKITTDILRKELGYDGVIVTDSLSMQALTKYYSSSDIAVKAFEAGADLLLCPRSLNDSINAIMNAVSSAEISEKYLDESVKRILTLKVKSGIIDY